MNVTDALAQSPNTAFAKLIQQVGVPRAVDMAVKLGLRSYAEPGKARAYDPDNNGSLADYVKQQNLGSFTLGPLELNALELSNVAATLASGGMWCPPTRSTKVIDRHGREVSLPQAKCEQVVPEGLANTLANALGKDHISGTAASSAGSVGWSLPMSGKTGTTESHRSSAFLGFHQPVRGRQLHLRRHPHPVRPVFVAAAQMLQRQPVRRQRAGAHVVLGDEADRQRVRPGGAAPHRPALCERCAEHSRCPA